VRGVTLPIPFHIQDVHPTGYEVPLNTNVIVTFNEPLDPSTIHDLSLTLTTDTGYVPVDGRIYSSGSLTQVVLEPGDLLSHRTRYRGLVPTPGIRSSTGEEIEEPYLWRFTTSASIASGVQTIGWEDPGNLLAAENQGDTIVGRILYPAADNMAIADGATLVPTGGASLNIEINAPPSGDLAWLSGFITLQSQDVLGWEQVGNHIGSTFRLDATPTTTENGREQIDGKTLTVSKQTGHAGFVDNTEYTLRVHAGIQASGYNEMPYVHETSWTTTFYPVYTTALIIRLLAGPFVENIPDDTIRRVILYHSRIATKLNGNVIFSPVPQYVTDYLSCQGAVDVIRQEFSARAGSSGRKQLGDLSIEVAVDDIKGLLEDTLARLQECADDALLLIKNGGQRLKPTTIVRGKYASGPRPGVEWSRVLDWVGYHGSYGAGAYSSSSPSWISDTSSRVAIYEKFLGGNPMPSTIEQNDRIYSLTNFNT